MGGAGEKELMICPVEVFDENSNFNHWRAKMESFFRVIDVYEVIHVGFNEPEEEEDLTTAEKTQLDQNRHKDELAKMWITMKIGPSIFEKISFAEKSKFIWDNLKDKFYLKTETSRVQFESKTSEKGKENIENGECSYQPKVMNNNLKTAEVFSSPFNTNGKFYNIQWASSTDNITLVSQDISKRMDNIRGLSLYKAALRGQLKKVRDFIDHDPEALTKKITSALETALHIAVGTGKEIIFVENLVRRMSPEELALTDQNGETALAVAAMVGNIEAAQLLVNRNSDLPNIASESGFPIHRAAQYGHKAMVRYLLLVTRSDIEPNPFSDESGVKLLVLLIIAEFFDIALELIKKDPDLAKVEHSEYGSPLCVLAEKPHAFPSGRHLNNNQLKVIKIYSYWKNCRDTKLMNRQVLELVKCLCNIIMGLEYMKAFSMFQRPLHLAAQFGVHEIVEEIVEAFPPALWSSNQDNHNVFQIAVKYRRENVFNLIRQMSDYRHLVTRYIDPLGNNILHLAGKLPPLDRLNLVSGAVLQMQRELQWFKEVEKFVQPVHKVGKNAQGKTPAFVFTEAHESLVKEGEKWMKDTSTSCTVAAALIATVVFAAAITVPGGNDQNKGSPLFIDPKLHQLKAIVVFGLFDAISLSSSVTSIMMFLSILTSRYSEADYLSALPRRLIFGLSMLFISISSLMVAFSTALYLVFGQERWWRLLLMCLLASVPVITFAFFQIPLFIEMTLATYGRGIFRKQGDSVIH